MEAARISLLNERPAADGKDYVLYWMQQAQRAGCNHALEHAVQLANGRGEGVVVGFGLTSGYPEANLRHYTFLLEGLKETAAELEKRAIRLVLRLGEPPDVVLGLAPGASIVVCDKGYMRHQRGWRKRVAEAAPCQVVEVEGELVVPVGVASPKAEIGARTLRPRILKLREEFLQPLAETKPERSSLSLALRSELDPSDIPACLKALRLQDHLPPSPRFKGGTKAARKLLARFLGERLEGYAAGRNEPASQHTSELSPYFQFGHISPIEVALAAQGARAPGDQDRASFLEELVIRRELSHNFVTYNEAYDRFEGLPNWARVTLEKHRDDRREQVYGLGKLEAGETHDPYFNAAMREMRLTGFMHNYMRMYWGKKILEYSTSPEDAFAAAIKLNNRHFLCGRGPNAYANVAWLFGQHDRPWIERPVFGQVRYMNAKGLERKFDIAAYVRWTEGLEG